MKVTVYGSYRMPMAFEDIDEVRWSSDSGALGPVRVPSDLCVLVIPVGTLVHIDGRQSAADDASTLPVMEPVSAV